LRTQHSVALLGLIFFSLIAQADPSQKITSLGTFSNYRFTKEHQYGTGLQLWQDGTSLFGLFSHSQGLIGDAPAGILDNVSFDPETGRITFTSKLTMGLHSCNVHKKGVPSQDIFHFEGVLSSMSLSGTLTHTDNLHPNQVPTKENIVLKKSDEWIVTPFRNRQQWEIAIKDILKLRGPKW
jgi:hypothetical protein